MGQLMKLHSIWWLLLLLLLSRFSCVQLCVTPQTAAHQAPPSLGFSRQEHWSGLPFPSSMHESEKWKWICSVVSDPQRPHGLQPTRLPCPWDLPGKSTGVGCHWLGGPNLSVFTCWFGDVLRLCRNYTLRDSEPLDTMLAVYSQTVQKT